MNTEEILQSAADEPNAQRRLEKILAAIANDLAGRLQAIDAKLGKLVEHTESSQAKDAEVKASIASTVEQFQAERKREASAQSSVPENAEASSKRRRGR